MELQQYMQKIQQVNDKLNLMNRITRHDILNQLTAILGYLDLMRENFPDPRLQEYVRIQIRAANNIRDQILFTKAYQDIGSQSPRWFDLTGIIQSAGDKLTLDTITLIVDVDRAGIHADPLLEKVFYTLIENAIRHGENVTQIRFSCHEQENGLLIVCEDNGIGVPAEHKEDIFDKKYFKHTGYGLFLSRTILSITGITIRETGTPGTGARFEIRVPGERTASGSRSKLSQTGCCSEDIPGADREDGYFRSAPESRVRTSPAIASRISHQIVKV